MKVIGLIGEQGAGKGTVAMYLTEKHEALSFRFSRALDDILTRLYIPNERKNMIKLVTALRSAFGEDILARILMKDVEAQKRELNVIDGIRMPAEVAFCRKAPGFKLLYITSPIQKRYQNIINRGEKANEQNLTFEEFEQTEKKAATEIHIPELAKQADATIVNDGTLEELYKKLDAFVASLK